MHTALVHGAHVGRFVLSMAKPQMPPVHVAVLHEPAAAGGHWEADVHWLVTHVPTPSHVPPVHGLPAALFLNPHVPAMQAAVWQEPGGACGHVAAVVHWLVTQVPAPSQVPPVQVLPAALLENPQVPLMQTAV